MLSTRACKTLGTDLADIFISYAQADREPTRKMAAALEDEGYSVWWDRQLLAGAEFGAAIERELAAARVVIAVWSADAVKSRWVRDEAGVAAEAGKLAPVSIDGAPAPIGFKQYHVINLKAWRGDAEAEPFQNLLRTVKTKLTGEAPPAAAAPTAPSWRKRLIHPFTLAGAGVLLAIGVFAFTFATRIIEKSADSNAAPSDGQTDAPTKAEEDAGESAFADIARASIAVLPFTDLSPEGDQAFFSDGVADEILNALNGVDPLKVASRTSSFQFRDQDKIGAPAIARRLKVRHLLGGSVRKSGETVRITAQLIDAATDEHLWSKAYDRVYTMNNLLAIQAEIAEAIVAELSDQMDVAAAAQAINVAADTQNLDAYEQYLKANALFQARGRENLRESIRLFEQITTLDPNFSRAWAGLAGAYAISDGWGLTDRDYAREAMRPAERAIALNPELSLPYAIVAYLSHKLEPRDWARAISNYDRAVENDPKNITARLWRGIALRQLGYLDEAIAEFHTCIDLDPDYNNCLRHIAYAYTLKRDYKNAQKYFREILANGHPEWAVGQFADLFAENDDIAALSYFIIGFVDTYIPEKNDWLVEPMLRAFTDETFDREEGLAYIERRLGPGLFAQKQSRAFANSVYYLFGAYDKIDPYQNAYHWSRALAEPENAGIRRRMINELGLPAYWRKHGFPPQCQGVGDNDFKCD